MTGTVFEFWLALFVFISSHSLVVRKLKPRLIALIGQKAYFAGYTLLSTLLLVWVIAAAIHAPRTALWPTVYALYWLPNILMPLAFILLAAGFIVPSPLSMIPRDKDFAPDRPPFMIAITRHPVLWGFGLWALSHIPVNGEYPLVLMFGIFALFALAGIKMIDRKRKKDLGNQWIGMVRNTPALPLASKGFWLKHWRFTRYDATAIIVGLILYTGFYHVHGILFGISPLPPLP